MAGEFGDDGLADSAGSEQFLRALHLGIHSAIVGHSEDASTLFCDLHHRVRLGFIHGHGLLAQHVLSRAKRLDRLWRMKEYWSRDVNRVNLWIGKSFVEGRPSPRIITRSFGRIARD